MPVEESQAIKTNKGAMANMILDHIIPLQLGGSNEENNLQLVERETWELFTPVENHIGKLLRSGKIKRKEAQQMITDFKNGKIKADEILSKN